MSDKLPSIDQCNWSPLNIHINSTHGIFYIQYTYLRAFPPY